MERRRSYGLHEFYRETGRRGQPRRGGCARGDPQCGYKEPCCQPLLPQPAGVVRPQIDYAEIRLFHCQRKVPEAMCQFVGETVERSRQDRREAVPATAQDRCAVRRPESGLAGGGFDSRGP